MLVVVDRKQVESWLCLKISLLVEPGAVLVVELEERQKGSRMLGFEQAELVAVEH